MVTAGIIVALITLKVGGIEVPRRSVLLGIMLMFSMIIDGGLQYLKKFPSTNVRRAVTGFLFGIGVTIIIQYYFS